MSTALAVDIYVNLDCMQITSVRTTVDLEKDLAHQLKEYSARHGLKQKTIIAQALKHYMGTKALDNDAKNLWAELRKLAKSGRQDIDLVEELRKDRSR